MSAERWTGLRAAAELVAQKCGASLGAARERLRHAVDAGGVRSRGVRLGYHSELCAIQAESWPDAVVEWDTDWPRVVIEAAEFVNVEIAHADLLYWLGSSTGPSSPAPVKNSGGRPRAHDRDAFYREIIRIANTPDGLPAQDALNRIMLDWCHVEWRDKAPDARTVREWVSALYDRGTG